MPELKELIATQTFTPARQIASVISKQSILRKAGQSIPGPWDSLSLGTAILLPLLAGGGGAIVTNSSVSTWYRTLKKPSWNPPAWVFGPVWTLLYLMMGAASWLVWREGSIRKGAVDHALKWYGLQLSFNFIWSFIFFGLRRIGLGLIDLVALWGALLTCLVKFGRIRALAGWLLVPYFLWVSFALTLNAAIWWLNRHKQ
jgi:tryptophan-rich sensory protein